MLKSFYITAILLLFSLNTFAQTDDDSDDTDTSSINIVDNIILPSDTLADFQDTTSYEDTLNIPPDAIIVSVHRGEMNPYKKKYSSSLYCMVEASPEDVTNFWKSKFKNDYAVGLRLKNGKLIAKEVNLLEISSRVITMYAEISQEVNQTKINVCLEVNKGVFVDSVYYTDDYNNLKKFIHNAIKQYYVDYYNSVLSNLEDQNSALLKQKQQVLNEKNQFNQSLIRNNKALSGALKIKLANETTITKSENRIRLNDERLRVGTEKIEKLETQLTEIKAISDTSTSHAESKLESIKMIEKDIQRTNSDVEKAEKAILKAEKAITKSEIKITQAEDTIKQESQEIEKDKREIKQKNAELTIINKKLDVKGNQINQVNRKISNIF